MVFLFFLCRDYFSEFWHQFSVMPGVSGEMSTAYHCLKQHECLCIYWTYRVTLSHSYCCLLTQRAPYVAPYVYMYIWFFYLYCSITNTMFAYNLFRHLKTLIRHYIMTIWVIWCSPSLFFWHLQTKKNTFSAFWIGSH